MCLSTEQTPRYLARARSRLAPSRRRRPLPQTDPHGTNAFQLDFAAPDQVSSYTLDVAYKVESSVEYTWVTTGVAGWYEEAPDEWVFTFRVQNHEWQAITDIHPMIAISDGMEITSIETVDLGDVVIPPAIDRNTPSTYDFTYRYQGKWTGTRTETQAVLVP